MHKLRYIKLLFIAVIVLGVIGISEAVNLNSRTHLSGDEEVPVRVTNAQGQAIFKLNDDGTELHYKLIVANTVEERILELQMRKGNLAAATIEGTGLFGALGTTDIDYLFGQVDE